MPVFLASALFRFLGVALLGAAIGAYGGYQSRGFIDAPIINKLMVDFAGAKVELANSEVRYKTLVAATAADIAKANSDALANVQAQAAVAARLRQALAVAEQRRAQASSALTMALSRMEAERGAVMLSPAVVAYVEAIRLQQGAVP